MNGYDCNCCTPRYGYQAYPVNPNLDRMGFVPPPPRHDSSCERAGYNHIHQVTDGSYSNSLGFGISRGNYNLYNNDKGYCLEGSGLDINVPSGYSMELNGRHNRINSGYNSTVILNEADSNVVFGKCPRYPEPTNFYETQNAGHNEYYCQ